MPRDPFDLGNLDDLAIGLKPSLLMRRLRDERGEPYVPDEWQEEFLDCDDPAVLMLAFRQSGKTTSVSVKALHVGLFEPGRLSLIISPTDRQSGIVLDRVKTFYGQLGGSMGEATRQTETRLRFANGAEVVSLPGGNPDQIRGFSNVRLLVIDEAARTDDDLYTAVLPMLAEDGQLVAPTTPAGRRGWFYREWREGEDWRRIRVPVEANKHVGAGKIAAARRRMTPAEYSVEYGLSFGGSEDALFPAEIVEAAMDRNVRLLDVGWRRFGGAAA
jgi:hypothetical protein